MMKWLRIKFLKICLAYYQGNVDRVQKQLNMYLDKEVSVERKLIKLGVDLND